MSDQIKWTCIHKTSNTFEAEAIKGNIESAGIPCVIVNKQDSSYLAFGYVEVHIPENRKDEVTALLGEDPTIQLK